MPPVRTCIGCRRRRPQAELVRLVGRDGRLIPGAGQPGRGAWLCRDALTACFDAATRASRWSRALRQSVAPASYAELRQQLASEPVHPVP